LTLDATIAFMEPSDDPDIQPGMWITGEPAQAPRRRRLR
jgi:hypothetical protein